MRKQFDGKLVKFTPNPKDIEEVTLTFKCKVCKADYLDMARLYLEPANIIVDSLQGTFSVQESKTGAQQLKLDEAAGQEYSKCEGCGGVADTPGGLCNLCAEEHATKGCPLCLDAPPDPVLCKGCLDLLDAIRNGTSDLAPAMHELIGKAREGQSLLAEEIVELTALVANVAGISGDEEDGQSDPFSDLAPGDLVPGDYAQCQACEQVFASLNPLSETLCPACREQLEERSNKQRRGRKERAEAEVA
ncbi:MAG: hypothetical protein C4542_09690 [Dehalococcoidia bacterium]|nr:MAG: hypothetical protein C4542_09690 [Dehalococcoidia bacterium]